MIGGELISSNADLNSLKTPGNYGCGNSVAATLANSPTTIGFRLEIGYAYGDNAYIYQLATRASDGRFYHRRCYVADGTWTAWRQFASVLDIYPVGAVYISYTSTSPASLFGGTWTAITGRFPYFNAGTGTGGSNTHALTVAQMPKNYASFTIRTVEGSNVIVASSGATVTNVSGDYSYVIVHATSGGDARKYTFTGSGSAHNNMPAYQTFYAWRRTA